MIWGGAFLRGIQHWLNKDFACTYISMPVCFVLSRKPEFLDPNIWGLIRDPYGFPENKGRLEARSNCPDRAVQFEGRPLVSA